MVAEVAIAVVGVASLVAAVHPMDFEELEVASLVEAGVASLVAAVLPTGLAAGLAWGAARPMGFVEVLVVLAIVVEVVAVAKVG